MPVFNSYKTNRLSQSPSIALLTDTIHAVLLTSAYVPNIDTQTMWADINANEVVGTGYTANGQPLANKTVVQDSPNDRGVFDADDVTWATATVTARFTALIKWTGVAATSPLIFYIDFVTDKSSSAADFTIEWDVTGILHAT